MVLVIKEKLNTATIFYIIFYYFKLKGPTRDAAATCLSSLLTRPDMDASALMQFIDCTYTIHNN
jgi:hypothetical protein